MTRDQAPQGDREKLAREMQAAWRVAPEDTHWFYPAADIAIAYADRRVAEAVAECLKIIEDVQPDEDAKVSEEIADAIRISFRSALSPAREGEKT